MYTVENFKTKKALKEAIANGRKIQAFQPNDMFGVTEKYSAGMHNITLEGPHFPAAHTWYAEAKIVDGYIVSVK